MSDARQRLQAWIKAHERPDIQIDYEAARESLPTGASKLGGLPDVPAGFVWPRFESEGYDGVQRERPLSFMAQLDLKEVSAFDKEGLLPKEGHLAFFYDCDSQPWGFDPKDMGGARVFYFPSGTPLERAAPPEDLDDDFQIPVLIPSFSSGTSQPSSEYLSGDAHAEFGSELLEEFLSDGIDAPDRCKMLGLPDILQGTIEHDCQLAGAMGVEYESRGKLSPEQEREYENGVADWMLLLQLGTLQNRDYEMMFGDCGYIYFCIRLQDLTACNFDNVWLVLQCC